MIKIARVRGTSMLPRLRGGDYVIAINLPWLTFNPGHTVLVLHPSLGLIIKRIFTVNASAWFTLVGDHPSSTSPEQIGCIERNQIIGRVIYRIAKSPV